jgi:hypothetical protein
MPDPSTPDRSTPGSSMPDLSMPVSAEISSELPVYDDTSGRMRTGAGSATRGPQAGGGADLSLYRELRGNLARQRYVTAELRQYLQGKHEALCAGDFAAADRLESGIARQAQTVALSKVALEELLAGCSLDVYIEGLEDYLAAPLRALLSETSRLEWLCLKELGKLNAFARQHAEAGTEVCAQVR